MPDLERERRLRERYNLDLPVTFRIDVGGVRDGVGRYRPNFISFTAWCRREDPQPATVRWGALWSMSYARSSMPRTSFWGGTSYALPTLPAVRGHFSRWSAPGWTWRRRPRWPV